MVCLSLPLITPLHAQLAADCDPVQVAVQNKKDAQKAAVDMASTNTADAVQKAKSCVDRVIQNVNSTIPTFGGGFISTVSQILIKNLANDACNVMKKNVAVTTNSVTPSVSTTGAAGQVINGDQAFTAATNAVSNTVNAPAPAVAPPAAPPAAAPAESLSIWNRIGSIF